MSSDLIEKEVEPSRDELDLRSVVSALLESWFLVLVIIGAVTVAGVAYVMTAKPIYRADAVLQVERTAKGISALTDISRFFEEQSDIVSEFEIISSRMVLGQVVDNLKLYINATPVGLFGGDHSIRIETLEVPDEYLGKPFRLVASKGGRYQLLDGEEKTILEGQVGEPASAPLGKGGEIKLFVSDLQAEPGDEFIISHSPRLDVIEMLRSQLRLEERGTDSGIIRITLEGTDPVKIADIINEVTSIYVRQNVERKSAETGKTLAFLEKQLPKLREQMEAAEAALNNYRFKRGSIDLPLETQSLLQRAVAIESELSELRRSREALIKKFTEEHPRIQALDAQIESLAAELAEVEETTKKLPTTQQEILRLTRNAEVASQLYTTLLNNAQELKVVKAGTVGNVRVIDPAVPPLKPVRPKKVFVVAMSFVLGLLIAIAAAIVRKRMQAGVEDPALVEKQLGLPVYATVPLSEKQRELNRRQKKGEKTNLVLATVEPGDLAVESMRSLRTSLHFAQLDAKNNIIMITGPAPGAGKTFVAANLATILASSGKRVLLVDGDMRKGRLHTLFGLPREGGLSELIAGNKELEEVIRSTGVTDLDFVSTGKRPPNPAELLMHERFASFLEEVSQSYDHVVIDTPPVLAVTDAAIIGRLAGATLLVLKDGQHPLREIEQSVKRLKLAGVNLRGAVFNAISKVSARHGYGRYYGYSYRYSDSKA